MGRKNLKINYKNHWQLRPTSRQENVAVMRKSRSHCRRASLQSANSNHVVSTECKLPRQTIIVETAPVRTNWRLWGLQLGSAICSCVYGGRLSLTAHVPRL